MNLSIIIPAYNCSNTIIRCLDSITTLPWDIISYEVIVIDDASTDNTRDVVRGYQLSHPQIRLLCQSQNHRQGAARNRGLLEAKGEYVLFVDSDDTIDKGIIIALKKAQINNLDICFFTMLLECHSGKLDKIKWSQKIPSVIDGKTFLNDCFDFYVNGPTRGVLKRDFLIENKLFFQENVRWEDGDFCIRMYQKAQSISEVDEIGYKYLYNQNSTSKETTAETIENKIQLGLRLIHLAETSFEQKAAVYTKIIEEAQWRYFHQNLRLRNLTKISWRENLIMHKNLTKSDWDLVSKYTLSKWEKVVCKHFYLASIVLFFACPLAKIGRYMTNAIRRNEI